MDNPSQHAHERKRRIKECRGSGHHGLPVVDATIRGVFISYEAVYFLMGFQLPRSF